MNRHQRRAAGRASVRDGRYGATGLGHATRAVPVAELPAKEAGRHRWVAIGTYTLTASQASAADAGSRVVLSPEMLVAFGIGCIDCERAYHGARTEPCAADDTWGEEDETDG